MLKTTINQANAALQLLNTTQEATQTMIHKKRQKISASDPLYRKINQMLPDSDGPGSDKNDPMTLDDEKEGKEDNEHTSNFKKPESESRRNRLPTQFNSKSVVEKSKHDEIRDKRRKQNRRKRHQKAPVSEPSVHGNNDEEEENDDEEEEEEKQNPASQRSLDRVNDQTHADQWVQMVQIMNRVQKTIEPWTVIPSQTLLSQISTALKGFPGGQMFPASKTLDEWRKTYEELVPVQKCEAEAKHINLLISSFQPMQVSGGQQSTETAAVGAQQQQDNQGEKAYRDDVEEEESIASSLELKNKGYLERERDQKLRKDDDEGQKKKKKEIVISGEKESHLRGTESWRLKKRQQTEKKHKKKKKI